MSLLKSPDFLEQVDLGTKEKIWYTMYGPEILRHWYIWNGRRSYTDPEKSPDRNLPTVVTSVRIKRNFVPTPLPYIHTCLEPVHPTLQVYVHMVQGVPGIPRPRRMSDTGTFTIPDRTDIRKHVCKGQI